MLHSINNPSGSHRPRYDKALRGGEVCEVDGECGTASGWHRQASLRAWGWMESIFFDSFCVST